MASLLSMTTHLSINHKITIMKKNTLIVLLAAFFFSCQKDPEPPTCATNATSLSGSYKITAVTYKENASAAEVDYYSLFYTEPCERDDILTFNANGTYQFTDAGIVCDPSNSDNSTWSLVGNTITVDGDPATIESFDCKTLVVFTEDEVVPGDKIKLTLTKQ
jgi:hypothetical protein